MSSDCNPADPGAARALAVPQALSGANGENRSSAFCYIQARHDLDAVRAYLNRYRDQPKTLRAYTKELERLLLWAVVLRGKALSDLRVDDCEAYKDFLKSPDPRFVGERFARSSPRWRPFATEVLSAESQRYGNPGAAGCVRVVGRRALSGR